MAVVGSIRPVAGHGLGGRPALAVLGAVLGAVTSAATVVVGWPVLGAVIAAVGFGAACLGFARAPHLMAAITICFLVVQPALLRFVDAGFGPAKDVVVIAAVAGTAIALWTRRASPLDAWLVAGIGLLLAVYVVNPSGGHGAPWLNGMRIVAEAVCLLLVGAASPQPARTWRWASGAIILVALLNVGYGFVQRALGVPFLVEQMGYTYGVEVRETSNGVFRAFGSLEEPFSYAAIVLFALAAAVAVVRKPRWTVLLAAILVAGVASSVVRTAAILVAFVAATALARRNHVVTAFALSVALLVAASGYVALTPQGGSSSAADFVLTLNGRTESWTALISSPTEWLGGRGVGDVGVGARRAAGDSVASVEGGAVQGATTAEFRRFNVDSSYLATVADVGVVGLVLFLAILTRAGVLALRGAGRGAAAGWMAITLIGVMLIDGLTRTSLTSFPSGYVGLYLIGISLAAAQAAPPRPSRRDPAIATARP